MKHPLYYLALMLVFFSPSIAQSSALTKPFNGYINKAVSNTIVKKLQTMGFAANDPIYGITLAAAETTLAAATVGGSVAATVGAVGSAPVWLSVALGIGAVYEIYDFTMGEKTFHVAPGAKAVFVSAVAPVISAPQPAPIPAADWQVAPTVFPVDYADPGIGTVIKYPNDLPLCATVSIDAPNAGAGKRNATYCGSSLQQLQDLAFIPYKAVIVATNYQRQTTTYIESMTITAVAFQSNQGPTKTSCAISPLICPEGIAYAFTKAYVVTRVYHYEKSPNTYNEAPKNTTYNDATSYTLMVFNNPQYIDPTKTVTLNDASAKLTTADLTARADPELLAAIANKIWQQAAQQPGYAGAPYDAANPVTAADVMADIAAGVYPHPTVADLLSMVSANAQTAPRLDPTAQPVEVADGAAKIDLGPDPGVAQPALETVPTGNAIVAQVMGLLPSLSGFTMPAHTSTCTAPTFSFFNSTQTMQPMCDLLEQQRALLSTIFSAAWGIVSLLIVLKA